MNVLISAYACEPNRGSEPGNGWNWAINVAKLGHEVWCLTTLKGKADIKTEVARLGLTNLHFIFVPMPRWAKFLYKYQQGLYLYYLLWQRFALKQAQKLHRQVNFDLVHHVTWGSLQLATPLWRLNAPLIFGPVGGGQMAPPAFKDYFQDGWRMELQRNLISKLLIKANNDVRKTLTSACEVLTTNPDTLKMAKRLGAPSPKLFLDPNLPEDFIPDTFPERQPGKELKILWVGRLLPRKGLPLVLEALSKVDPAIPFTLTIIGDGPMRRYLPGWLKKYNLEDKVKWEGHQPWHKVKEAYLHHDLFLFTSLRDSSAAQLLEAMAFGLPVITLDLHGASCLVPDAAGMKVMVDTPETTTLLLADAVEHLYRLPNLRIRMGKAGYKFACKQVWSEKVRQLYGKYNKPPHYQEQETAPQKM